MIVLGILQNQWFREPEKVREILERASRLRGPEAARLTRRRFCARALFAGCRTGLILRQSLGDELCQRIVWENASPELGGHAASKFPANMDHLREVLADVKPDVVIALGRIAEEALRQLVPWEKLFCCPHPTARGVDVRPHLKRLKSELEKRNGNQAT